VRTVERTAERDEGGIESSTDGEITVNSIQSRVAFSMNSV
jgi:hypothetical protein